MINQQNKKDLDSESEEESISKPSIKSPINGLKSLKLSSGICIIFSLTLIAYYYSGGVRIPSLYLLAVTAQILSKAVSALCSFVLNLLVTSKTARKGGLPVDMITATVIEMDCRLGTPLNAYYLFFHGIVAIFIYITPEVLLTNLATGVRDIRPVNNVSVQTELGSFGGGYNESLYSLTSGLILLSSINVDDAYGEVAYKSKNAIDEFIIPRKPVVFYSKYAETGVRGNSDREKQVSVNENEALSITKIDKQPSIESCRTHESSSCNYFLKMINCNNGIFGFEYGGPDLDHSIQFFQLRTGDVSIEYKNSGGYRRLNGGEMKHPAIVPQFPRAEELWTDMGNGFLNTISFGRVPSETYDISTKLAISSIVRMAGIQNYMGFDSPPKIVDATVSDVTVSNLSFWALLVSLISSLALLLHFLYERYYNICLTPSLRDFLKACDTELMDTLYSDEDDRNLQSSLRESINVLCVPHSSKEDGQFDSVRIHKKYVKRKVCDKRFLLHADDDGNCVTIDCGCENIQCSA